MQTAPSIGRFDLRRVFCLGSLLPVVRPLTHCAKGNHMKLYPDDWRIRVTSALAVAACMAAAMMLGPMVGIDGVWPGGLAIIVAIIVGIVLGGLVGRLLFRPSSGGPPDHRSHA